MVQFKFQIKYLLAMRCDLASKLLENVYPSVFLSLEDEVDDVVSVAAGALIPVAPLLLQSTISIIPLIKRLWDALKTLDDLSSSTHSIMYLVSKTATHMGIISMRNLTNGNFQNEVPAIKCTFRRVDTSESVIRMTNSQTFCMPCMRKCRSNSRFCPIKCAVGESAILTADSLTAHFIGETSKVKVVCFLPPHNFMAV